MSGGINTYAYVGGNPLRYLDSLELAKLTYAEIANLVANGNLSGLSNELIICLIWKESGFNPSAQSSTSTARGLMQLTKGAVKDVKANWTGFDDVGYAEMFDAAANVSVGSAYISTRVDWANGNVQNALNGYGTGLGYSANIIECEKCLKEQKAQGSTPCPNPQTCLEKIHR